MSILLIIFFAIAIYITLVTIWAIATGIGWLGKHALRGMLVLVAWAKES